jgi:hypothetical protein
MTFAFNLQVSFFSVTTKDFMLRLGSLPWLRIQAGSCLKLYMEELGAVWIFKQIILDFDWMCRTE